MSDTIKKPTPYSYSEQPLHSPDEATKDFSSLEEDMRRMQMEFLHQLDSSYIRTVSMTELYENVFYSCPPIIDGLLYPGTYLFVGTPKLGKSFLMEQLAYHVSTGIPLWDYPIRKGTVLYLALEDDYRRLQTRLDLIQVGDMHDTGCGTHDAETAKQCLTEYYEHYIKNNPNFFVFNAVIHMDEATPHLHIDYIPIGHYEKGLDTRNAMAQALSEMGYKGVNAVVKWREHEREVFTEICKSHGFEIAVPNKSRGYNFKCEEYREIQEEKKRLIEELQPLREMNLAAESKTVKGSKIPLSNKIAVSSDEMALLKQQKKAAAVQALDNQRERDSIEQYKQSLDKREAEISEKEEQSLKEQTDRTNDLNVRERSIFEKEIKLSELRVKQQYITIGYFATKQEALQALANYNENPYDIATNTITFSEVYER